LLAAVPFSKTLLTQDERNLLAAFGQSYLSRLASYLAWTRKQGEANHAV